MVQQNRLSHALLFLGKEGSGALPLAIAFAQSLTAPPPPKGGYATAQAPLNEDASNKRDTPTSEGCEMAYPPLGGGGADLHFSYPVITKKTGSPPVSTDYITEWREFLQTYPYGNVYDWLQFIGADNKQGNITAQECNEIIRKLSLKSFEGGYKILIMWMPE